MRPLLCAALIALAGPATAAPPSAVPLTVDAGEAKRVSGTLKGYRLADYRLPLEAGQTVRLELRSGKPAAYFNLQAPGADAGAMFIGSIAGERFDTVAPVSGDYLVRVYLMRSAARRNELARYTLSVQAGAHPGKAAAGDALVAGTPYHATASIRCLPAGGPAARCEAGAMRREAGAGTVRVVLPDGAVRHVAFVGGQAVSCDGPAPFEATRSGDTSVVTLGNGDRFEIPDALVSGG